MEPPASPPRRGWVARAWTAPLWAHTLALAAVLVVVGVAVRPTANFTSDESAVLLQTKMLREGDGWLMANPLPQLDPDGVRFWIKLPDGGPEEFAPYAKHPIYPLVLRSVTGVAGVPGAVGTSVLGTVAAALAAAALTRQVRPGGDRAALWIAGVASPLFFDAQLVVAHTLGAAACGWATWALLRRDRGTRAGAVVLAAALVALAVLLRSEAVLYAVALGGVVGVVGLLHRRIADVAAGVAIVGVAGVSLLLERAWTASILGSGVVVPVAGAGQDSSLTIRATASLWTVVGPTRTEWGTESLAATAAMVLSVVAVVLVRRYDERRAATAVLAAVAAITLLACFAPEPAPVTGVLPAFPLLVVGLGLLRRDDLRDPPVGALIAVAGAFAVMVLATSYQVGGAAEWGGRFFALAIPAVVAVIVRSVATALPPADAANRPPLLALGALSAAMALLGVAQLRWSHDLGSGRADAVTAAVDAIAADLGPDLGDGDRRPVVLATWTDAGRFAWRDVDRVRGTLVPPEELPEVLDRLADAGATSVVVVGDDLDAAVTGLEGAEGWVVDERREPNPPHGGAVVVRRAPT